MRPNRRPAGTHVDSNGRAKVKLGTFNTKVLNGEIDLTTWSEDDLVRMMRDGVPPGRAAGPANQLIPVVVAREYVARLTSQGVALIRLNLLPAIAYVGAVIHGEERPDAERLKASIWSIERVLGKAPQQVTIKTGDELTEEEALLLRAAQQVVAEVTNKIKVVDGDG